MDIILDPKAREWILARGGKLTLDPPAGGGG